MAEPLPHIVHLITSLHGGGTENFLHQILQGSPPNYRHSVLYLKQDGIIGDRIRTLGIPVLHVSPVGLFQKLRAERPDVLHTCLFTAHQLGRLVGHWAGVPRIISSQRAVDGWIKPWHVRIDRFTLEYCNAALVNSKAAEEVVRRRSGADLPVYFIPNGVDWRRLQSPTSMRRQDFFSDLPADAILGGSLMRLHREKGADFIPLFAERLLIKHPRLHLLIAGNGPLRDDLRRRTSGQPYTDRLRWLDWIEDPISFLKVLDFFWLLSREESTPQVLVEATGAACPWISPAIGGVPGLIAEGSAGLTFPVGEMAAAVNGVNEILSRLDDWRGRAELAAPHFRELHSLNRTVSAFYEAVDEVRRRDARAIASSLAT